MFRWFFWGRFFWGHLLEHFLFLPLCVCLTWIAYISSLRLTASLHLKIDGWKLEDFCLSFWVSAYFQGRTVSFGECIIYMIHLLFSISSKDQFRMVQLPLLQLPMWWSMCSPCQLILTWLHKHVIRRVLGGRNVCYINGSEIRQLQHFDRETTSRVLAMMNKQLLKPNTFWLNEARYVSDAHMRATCNWKRSGEFVYDAYLSMIRLACVLNRFAFLVRYISSMCGLDSF